MSDDPQQPNKIDEYILIAPVASGKSAVVWEVMHEQTNQMLAMKLLNQNSMQDANEKNLLKQEAKIGSLMEHPNLIRNHGVVIRKTECYLLMDLFKTPNLKALINSSIQLVHANFRQLVEGLCAGLGHMHEKGWVHKDLKPDNILLNRAGEVRIIDFSLAVKAAGGLSKLMGGSKGPIRGTRTYLAPETIRKEPSTPATDIYSIGITLYECLTGTVPFKGDTPQDLLRKHIAAAPPLASLTNERVTPEMDRLIEKMLAKKPKDRYQSMDEVLMDFKKIEVFKKVEEDEEEAKEKEAAKEQTRASAAGLSDAESEELRELMSSRRDSRADARIQAMIQSNPAMQREYEAIQEEQRLAKEKRDAELKRRAEASTKGQSGAKTNEKKPPKKKKRPAQPQQQPQPAMPYPMQQPMPPGYAMPPQQMPYAMPPQGYPQAPPPGYPQAPPQGYPQMPMQQPGMPPQGYPQQPMPGQVPQQFQPPGPVPPQAVPPQAVPPQQPAPPAAQPPQPANPATPPAKSDDDGMEFMTELPDIE